MIDEISLLKFFRTDMSDFLVEEWNNLENTNNVFWDPNSELTYWVNRLSFDGVEFTLLELIRLYDTEFPEVDQWFD